MEVEWPLKEEECDLKVWSIEVVRDTQCSIAESCKVEMNFFEMLS